MVRVLSLLMSVSVLLTGASVPQPRPRETPRVEVAETGTDVEDHLQSLLELRDLEERVSRFQRQQQQRASVPTRPVAHKPPPPARLEIVIRYALAQVGKPYVWAADGPGSFDCSGLVLASFARIGVKLPHYTGWIINKGQRVSRSQLQRGDVVFPERGHVGIYLGGGMFVHASSSRDRVSVNKLPSFYAARRF